MKHVHSILGFFLACPAIILGMDQTSPQNWMLIQQYNNQTNLQSTYFDKQGRLIVCKKGRIDQIDIQTHSILSLNNRTVGNLLTKEGQHISKNFETKNFESAFLLRNGQFLAWSTSDINQKAGATNATHLITLENSLSERKTISEINNQIVEAMPAFDSDGQPNYLLFGSDCVLAPHQFDAQEQLLAISVGTQIGICKIDPNADFSRTYIARYQCEHPIVSLCFHPIKKIVAALTKNADGKSYVSLFNIDEKKQLFSLLLKKIAYSLCFNNDHYVAVATDDSVEIIDLEKQKVKKRVNGKNCKNISSCCFHPQKNVLAMLCNYESDSVLYVMNLDSNCCESIVKHNPICLPLQCFDPTGTYLAAMEKDSVKIYKNISSTMK